MNLLWRFKDFLNNFWHYFLDYSCVFDLFFIKSFFTSQFIPQLFFIRFFFHPLLLFFPFFPLPPLQIDKDMSGLMRLKICDFGLSLEVEGGKMAKVVCGSPYYMAPEIFTQEGFVGRGRGKEGC